VGLDELRKRAEADPTPENLRALKEALKAELTARDKAAGDEELRGQAAKEWEQLEGELKEVARWLVDAEREASVAEARAKYRSLQFGSRTVPFDGSDVRSLPAGEVRSRALAVVEDDSFPGTQHLRDDQRDHLARLLRTPQGNQNRNGVLIAQRVLLTCEPDYMEAFARLVTQPHAALSPEQARALRAVQEWRAMNIGTDSAGGYAVPVVVDPTFLLTAQGHPNDIIGLARVESITTDAWRGITTQGVNWTFTGEAAEATDNSPTLAQPVVPTHKATGTIRFSIEAEGDIVDFNDNAAELLDEGYSELLVNKLTTGSGSSEPTGIETALDANTNVEVEASTSGAITAADVNKLWSELPKRWRNPANRDRQAWMGHTGVGNAIQLLGEEGGAAFTVNLTADGVMQLKGRNFFENDYLDNLPSGTQAANLLIVGDWRNFLVAQRVGMSVELIPHLFGTTNNMPTGERMLYGWARVGSDSINDDGFRMLQNNNGA
jgi:HK97 family phage major capsid protein